MENKGCKLRQMASGKGGLEGYGGRIPDGSESCICVWRGRGGKERRGDGGGNGLTRQRE